jgi:hypothetical protein
MEGLTASNGCLDGAELTASQESRSEDHECGQKDAMAHGAFALRVMAMSSVPPMAVLPTVIPTI